MSTEDDIKAFQERLISLRKSRGYSQTAFARILGISPRMMCHYERETENLPPTALLIRIAQALDCSIDSLLSIEPIEPDGRTVQGRLLKRFQQVAELPEADRALLVQMLDTLLAKNQLINSDT